MNLTIDLWQLVGALGSLLGVFVTLLIFAGKALLNQIDQRFTNQELSRKESKKHWDDLFKSLEQQNAADNKEWQRIERDMLNMKANMSDMYIRRDDFIRVISVIEAKIDGLAMQFQNALITSKK